MAKGTKRPWKVISVFRTFSFATQVGADKRASQVNGAVSGPKGESYYLN